MISLSFHNFNLVNKKIEIVILLILGGIAFWLLQNAIFFFDGASSIIPGWHTTIYPPYFSLKILGGLLILVIITWRMAVVYFSENE